ncbi:MAG: orotidine-5'-phosphate decarboxylase [Caldimicrobium sp.]|nr:orotidine-5'-phosphate decarboxylase [Caldimicrobium sp.]MCX7873710.1 orotidine-5'-phosphate decarboxylase [Caldimicrobium sp.]MDW8093634.1 orotidine-5'-phosphate decarboxylase [Caldimicrobium sp.]
MNEARERLIFPLDFPDLNEALAWVENLNPFVGVFKIGLELYVKYGPRAVEEVKKRSPAKIFLDLKLHDIPNTMVGAVRAISNLGVDFLTVHILSGRKAIEDLVKTSPWGLKIFGVTILTSLDKADLLELGFNGELASHSEELALKMAYIAYRARCDGVVTSAKEVARIKEALPSLITIVPGIRMEERARDDQLRTATPYEAILSGADYIVIGRPIREASQPEVVCKKILEEIERAWGEKG